MSIQSTLLILLVGSGIGANAYAASCESPAQVLRTTAPMPAASPLSPVKVSFSLQGTDLHVQFNVVSATINAKPQLGPGEYPFQRDVVEVFVSVGDLPSGDLPDSQTHLPYYEFEVSPYNQSYEVKILNPKKPFQGGIHTGMLHSATQVPGGWTAEMIIPLAALGWKGDINSVVGNAFAILGIAPQRYYMSLFLPGQIKPNFHLPRFFKPLLAHCQ